MSMLDTAAVAIAGILGAAAVAIAVLCVIYNSQELQVKATLYRECLATNDELTVKALAKNKEPETIYCYMR